MGTPNCACGEHTRKSQAEREDAAAAGGDTMDLCDRRDAHVLESIDNRVQPPLIRQAIVWRLKIGELVDVGAGGKGVAGGAEDEHADRQSWC